MPSETTLLAPNGKPSNLTLEQYRLVRSPKFIQWFGDWQNNPDNASKVLDENGEPKVVYHGSRVDFTVFDKEKMSKSNKWENGFYFTDDYAYAKSYANSRFSEIKTREPISVFLNLRDKSFIHKNSTHTEYIILEPNQIKISDGSNKTFDSNNPDIRYSEGGLIAPNGKPSNLTLEQYRLVRSPKFIQWFGDWQNDPANSSKVLDENGEPKVMYHGSRADFNIFSNDNANKLTWTEGALGFYFTSYSISAAAYGTKIIAAFINSRNIKKSDESEHAFVTINQLNKLYQENYDSIYFDGQFTKTNGQRGWKEDELVVFQSNQIKIADGSNITFDANNPDIRYAKGGEIIRRADGSYSKRGLWDNIRANAGSGKKPTKEMLEQERKIKSMADGGISDSKKIEDILNTLRTTGSIHYKEGDMSANERRSATQKNNYSYKKLIKLLGFDIGNLPSHSDKQKRIRNSLYKLSNLIGSGTRYQYESAKELSSEYEKQKSNGTNSELVKTVDEVLDKPTITYAVGGVTEFNKNQEKKIKEDKEDYKYDGTEKDLQHINSRVAIDYLQYIATSIGDQAVDWDWENRSKEPTNHFQLTMYLSSGNILKGIFVYVDNNHQVVASRSEVSLLDEDYNPIRELIAKPRKEYSSEVKFKYKGHDLVIERSGYTNPRWSISGDYLSDKGIYIYNKKSRKEALDLLDSYFYNEEKYANRFINQQFEFGGFYDDSEYQSKNTFVDRLLKSPSDVWDYYPDNYYILSQKKEIEFKEVSQDNFASDKPNGLWFAKGDTWVKFVKSVPLPHEKSYNHIHKIELTDKVLQVKKREEAVDFEKKYGIKSGMVTYIKWNEVANDYSGVYFEEPRLWSKRGLDDLGFLYPWDVPSGCIWKMDGIKKIERVL